MQGAVIMWKEIGLTRDKPAFFQLLEETSVPYRRTDEI